MTHSAVFLLLAVVAGVRCACPGDFKQLGNQCYKIHTQRANWPDALSYCAEMRAHLATVNTKEVNDFLVNQIKDNPLLHGKYYWIGAAALEVKKQYRWIDGTPFTYTNWYPNEPNDQSGMEDCLELMSDSYNYQWNDAPCTNDKGGFICQAAAY